MNKPASKSYFVLRLAAVAFAATMIGGYVVMAHHRAQEAERSIVRYPVPKLSPSDGVDLGRVHMSLTPLPSPEPPPPALMTSSKSGVLRSEVVTSLFQQFTPTQKPNFSNQKWQGTFPGQADGSPSSAGTLAPGSKNLVPVITPGQTLPEIHLPGFSLFPGSEVPSIPQLPPPSPLRGQ